MSGLQPFFCYYGGKWRDTPKKYPAPMHDTIIEPFAGSAGYSLRYALGEVHLYDTDPVVVSVWDYLIHASPEEILALPDVPNGSSVDDLAIPQAAKWLIGFWLNKGVASPRKTPSAWMRSGIRPGSFWGPKIRDRIASQVEDIRHWKVWCAPYQSAGNWPNATWFIDPPYQGAGKHYKHGSAGIDYEALAQWCKTRNGQVIVCENEGATWLPFQPIGSAKTTRKTKRSMESMWTNEEEK